MISNTEIQKIADRIAALEKPEKIILFGSYARGEQTNDSDLDFLVVKKHVDNFINDMVRIRDIVGPVGLGVDVLVYNEEDFEERKDWISSTVYWANKEGKVLYEAKH
jgi:predicted nucleotidyltransferase